MTTAAPLPNLPPHSTVRVPLAEHAYDVVLAPGLLHALGHIARRTLHTDARRILLAHDRGLPPATIAAASESLHAAGFQVTALPLQADEAHKSWAALEGILVALAQAKLTRRDALIALGGGVIGDLAGFAAAVYRRGIPFIQCPTTLLAMVDASVGGKTAVNLRLPAQGSGESGTLKKNLIGAFHQPAAVLIDPDTLATLPDRHFIAGLAECAKHAFLAASWNDSDLLNFTTVHAAALRQRDPAALLTLIRRNVTVKARVVAADQREEDDSPAGGRAQLNLGHTFGHALEPLPSAQPLRAGESRPAAPAPLHHGEAVALGTVAAFRCAVMLGRISAGDAQAAIDLIAALGLPTRAVNLPPTPELLEAMSHDKKVLGSELRLVLPEAPGRVSIVTAPPSAAVTAALDSLRA